MQEVKQKPQCNNCKFYSSGVAEVLPSGKTWIWEECQKSWGKPTPIGVLKNVCSLWVKSPNKD
jgi:hypothetical protein